MDDPAYKRLLTHRRIARDLLIGFIAPLRPACWAEALDFATLRDRATENVTDALRRRLGDVVWSIDRRDGRGGMQTLHVVIEHQSSVDYSMPLRFLNYTSLLYQRLYRDRTTWSKTDRADPVLHVVVYNGYEEVSAVLLEKIDRWEAEILERGIERGIEQGIEQGIERQRALLHRLAEHRFGPAAAERLSAVLAGVTEADRLAEAGEWIVDSATNGRLPGPREQRGRVAPATSIPVRPESVREPCDAIGARQTVVASPSRQDGRSMVTMRPGVSRASPRSFTPQQHVACQLRVRQRGGLAGVRSERSLTRAAARSPRCGRPVPRR